MLFDVICEKSWKKLHEWDPIVNFGDSDSSNCCVNWCLSSSSWGDHEGRSGISFPGILEKFLVCPVVFRQFPESFPRSLNACPMTFHQLASSQNPAKFPRKLKNPQYHWDLSWKCRSQIKQKNSWNPWAAKYVPYLDIHFFLVPHESMRSQSSHSQYLIRSHIFF